MSDIAIITTDKYYYPKELFRPDEKFPECPFCELNKNNHVYKMVREGFIKLGLDKYNFGLSSWNPLGKFIKKGDMVVIKPNLVMDYNPTGEGVECLYTQPSIVSAVVDYVIIALKGEGKIIIGDAPMQECNFEKLIQESGYDRLLKFYKDKLVGSKIDIYLEDFRDLRTTIVGGVYHQSINKDSQGIVVDLGSDSEFFNLSDEQYDSLRITNYDPSILKTHHNKFKNEYYINRRILEADVIINVPKPKTHRKAGITIALKNLIGINARKEYLPHHMNGSKSDKMGDEYFSHSYIKIFLNKIIDIKNKLVHNEKYICAKILGFFIRCLNIFIRVFFRDKYLEGSWYGNNTISKTIVDLNKIVRYADKNGKMCDIIQRNYFIVADMIISGEKEGPVNPSPKNVGIIAMGENPVLFDELIGTLMGAKMNSNPTILCAKKSLKKRKLYLNNDKCIIKSNNVKLNNKTIKKINKHDILYFEPTYGWRDSFLRK